MLLCVLAVAAAGAQGGRGGMQHAAGTLAPKPLDPGRPWGWAVRAFNDNMLVIVMIETIEGVNNALEIASQPGVDVVILGNADLTSFSSFPASDNRYQDLLTRTRDATYLAGKFWGNANFAFATGNKLSADSRFHQNGPAHDGWKGK
jgi:hypothetical protein